MNSKPDSTETQILNDLQFSELLEKKILGGEIREKIFTRGAIGQIDLVGSTAFTVSKTSIRNSLEKEAAIFEANLSGNKLDFEDEMILTRNDLIKKDIVYGVKSSAYNGILIGRLRIIAKWLKLEVLGTEGDKIIVFGEDSNLVLQFCLIAAEIFAEKSQSGHSGFGFRCGIAGIDKNIPLILYVNQNEEFISAYGEPISIVEKLEASAVSQTILCNRKLVEEFQDLEFEEFAESQFKLINWEKICEENFEIKENVRKFLQVEKGFSEKFEFTNTSIQKRPIAFISFDFNKEQGSIFIRNLVRDLKINRIHLLRFGIVRNDRVSIICQPFVGENESKELLIGFQNLVNEGYNLKAGLTTEFLWSGNITLQTNEESIFDVMGQGINMSARLAYNSVKKTPESEIIVSSSFIESLNEEGYELISSVNSFFIEAKGFGDPIEVYEITKAAISTSDILEIINRPNTFSEKVLEVSNTISNIIFAKTRNYYFSINASSFLITKLILYSGQRNGKNDEEMNMHQQNDFCTLAKIALASVKNGHNIIDTLENIIAKIPDLEFPKILLNQLDLETQNDLQNISMITFGRFYDFRISTLRYALSFSEEKIKTYNEKGFLILDGKTGFGHLIPTIAYLLDLKANEKERLELHKLITVYLWKSLKKYKANTKEWYDKARIIALHARYVKYEELSKKLRNTLIQVFEYAIKDHAYLDILLFEGSFLLQKRFKEKPELIYQLALVNLKFEQNIKAYEILTKLIVEIENSNSEIYEKTGLFYLLCKLNQEKMEEEKKSELIAKIRIYLDQSNLLTFDEMHIVNKLLKNLDFKISLKNIVYQ